MTDDVPQSYVQPDSRIGLITDMFQTPLETGKSAKNCLSLPKGDRRVTPMMAQYLEIKAANPDCLLFYRMGDFFELFFDDAEIASRALGIMLTKRGRHEGLDIPMCGVPIERADDYLQKLIVLGHRVAICEQMEEASEAKKRGAKSVVQRKVIRLITPGTVVEENLVAAHQAHFLAAVVKNPKGTGLDFGLALVDLSSGIFQAARLSQHELALELAKQQPKELVVPPSLIDEGFLKTIIEQQDIFATRFEHPMRSAEDAHRHLREFYAITTLAAFGDFHALEFIAASFLLSYVERTQIAQKPVLRPLAKTSAGRSMAIDPATRANLELTKTLKGDFQGSVLETIRTTVTSAGDRLLASDFAAPLLERTHIESRLDAVAYFHARDALRHSLQKLLKSCPDCERALARLALKRGGPRDLLAIAKAVAVCQDLLHQLTGQADKNPLHEGAANAILLDIHNALQSCPKALGAHITAALNDEVPGHTRDGNFIRHGYDQKLDEARALRDQSQDIIAGLQQEYNLELSQSGIKHIRIKFNNFIGYYFELPKVQGERLLSLSLSGRFIHRQTMSDAMRFSTPRLMELEAKITKAAQEAFALEQAIFETLGGLCQTHARDLHALMDGVARLDVCVALAELAHLAHLSRPIIHEDATFRIVGGRHMVVERTLRKRGEHFIGNDCCLSFGDGQEGLLNLVTGPNMAGKSTYLRQNALIVILAQMGSFVPADEAHIGIVDQLFSRVGASDDLARGRSTFMVEMVETAAILNQAKAKSLVIVDEIGRGTATYDGLSIAWATLEHLHDRLTCRTLFATHYHELTQLAPQLSRLRNLTLEVKEWNGGIVFLHKIIEGCARKSYGIEVARLAGLPASVIARAKAILADLEISHMDKNYDDLFAASRARLTAKSPLHDARTLEALSHKNDARDEALARIQALSLDELRPIEAMNVLYEIKRLLS